MIDIVLKGGVHPLFVILGCDHERIRTYIQHPEIKIIVNKDWAEGISSSIRTGIRSTSDIGADAAFIFVMDQPFLHPRLIRTMIDIFKKEAPKIIAPRVNGQQTNPVLFSNTLFPELMLLEGDHGAKKILDNQDLFWFDWDDPKLLMDIDSMEDYQRVIHNL